MRRQKWKTRLKRKGTVDQRARRTASKVIKNPCFYNEFELGSVCDEIEKHFEQSLSLLDQKHQKSKSLPRAMKGLPLYILKTHMSSNLGSFPPSFFDQSLKQHSSTDSLQNSTDSSSLGPMRVHRTHSSSKRNRNREVENKDSHKKGRQYKQLQEALKNTKNLF